MCKKKSNADPPPQIASFESAKEPQSQVTVPKTQGCVTRDGSAFLLEVRDIYLVLGWYWISSIFSSSYVRVDLVLEANRLCHRIKRDS